jgi:hypothetical protein
MNSGALGAWRLICEEPHGAVTFDELLKSAKGRIGCQRAGFQPQLVIYYRGDTTWKKEVSNSGQKDLTHIDC